MKLDGTMPWLSYLVAGHSSQWYGLNLRPDHVRFMVDEVALGQVLLLVFVFYPVIIVLQRSILIFLVLF